MELNNNSDALPARIEHNVQLPVYEIVDQQRESKNVIQGRSFHDSRELNTRSGAWISSGRTQVIEMRSHKLYFLHHVSW